MLSHWYYYAPQSRLASFGHMSKDGHQVMGVLIVEVWAVVPEVFLPCLSYQMGVLAKHLLMASHQHFVKRHYLLPFQTGGPSGVAMDVALLKGGMSVRSGEWCHHLGLGEGPGAEEEEALGVGPCWEGDAPWGMLKRWDIGVCPSNTWQEARSMPQDLRGLASRVAWQMERKLSWPLLSSLMASSSRCWMP